MTRIVKSKNMVKIVYDLKETFLELIDLVGLGMSGRLIIGGGAILAPLGGGMMSNGLLFFSTPFKSNGFELDPIWGESIRGYQVKRVILA